MAFATSSNQSGLLWNYFVRKTLDYVVPKLAYDAVGDRVKLPQQYGSQVTFTKFKKLPAVTTAGTEGQPPTLRSLTSTSMNCTVSTYKDAVGITEELVKYNSVQGFMDIVAELVGEQMKESIDTICRDYLLTTLLAASAVQLPAGRAAIANVTNTDYLTLPYMQLVKLTFKKNNVGPHKTGNYVFVGHPNSVHRLKTDTAAGGWIDLHKYSDEQAKKLFPDFEENMDGTVDGISVMSTSLTYATNDGAAAAYVYRNMMFGYQPFGSVRLDDNSTELRRVELGKPTIADPLGELGSIGWKAYYVNKYFGGNATVSDPERAYIVYSGDSLAP